MTNVPTETPEIGKKPESVSYTPSIKQRFISYVTGSKYQFICWLRSKLLHTAFALHKNSNLVEHARKELKYAGLFDKDSDYGGMLGNAVLELVYVHSMQGHSGYSHKCVLSLFSRVADFKTLTPITDNPDEWMDISGYQGGEQCWQNRRTSSLFSLDGGKTYYDLDDKEYVYEEKWKDEDGEEHTSYYSSLPPLNERKMYTSVDHTKTGIRYK